MSQSASENEKKVEKQTAVVAMAMVILGTFVEKTSGNNLLTEVGLE